MQYNLNIGRNAADSIAEMVSEELKAMGEQKPTETDFWRAYRKDLESVLTELEKRKGEQRYASNHT